MTCIAVRCGVMAADSQCGGPHRLTYHKITKLDHAIVGVCGNVADAQVLVKWFINGADRLKPPAWVNHTGEKPDAEIIVMLPDGTVYTIDDHLARIERSEFCAIGSGASAALGAMHMGADPRRAVEVAALVDVNTGGAVETATFQSVAVSCSGFGTETSGIYVPPRVEGATGPAEYRLWPTPRGTWNGA